MVTFFGISKFSAIEYPSGTPIKHVAFENEYVIERIESGKDYNNNYSFNFKIYNKKLESQPFKRNGWSLGDFQTNHGWSQAVVYHLFRDVTNETIYYYEQTVKIPSLYWLTQTFGKGRGHEALNLILEKFLEISEYKNWHDYLKNKHDIILEYQNVQDLPQEINPEVEITSLKEELEKLKLENDALKSKLKQLEPIITKANRILQKLSKKSGK